ncbi:MAG: hypothetical protein IJN55_08070 [Alistipes sp.]|nr:hypothetical protein [Alistipes sp.]
MKKRRYWLVVKDVMKSYVTNVKYIYVVGDVFSSFEDEATESVVEIDASLAKELKKIQTKIRRVNAEQENFYKKDMDFRCTSNWRYSRKMEGLAIEERTYKRRYAELIEQRLGLSICITQSPRYGVEIKELVWQKSLNRATEVS